MNNIAVYRCHSCNGVLTEWKIITGDGCKCGGRKLSPTYPTFIEGIKLLPQVLRLYLKKRGIDSNA